MILVNDFPILPNITRYWSCAKAEWKVEIQEQLQKIKSDGACYPQQLEEELIRRRRQELRSAQLLMSLYRISVRI